MEINKNILNQVLNLAHIEIEDSKKEALLSDLQGVLNSMAHLNSLNLDDIDPYAWVQDQSTPFREDKVVEANVPFIEENAPDWKEGAFSVPQILGGDD